MALKKKISFVLALVITFLGSTFFVLSQPLQANPSVEDLKGQVEALRAEVAQLKAAQHANDPTTASHIPNVWGPTDSGAWNPFSEMQQMQDRMNRLFRNSFKRSDIFAGLPGAGFATPASFYEPDLDIQDRGDDYLLTLDLPGLDKDKINIEVTDHEILVSGERNYESEEQDNGQGFYRMERRFGSFSRRLPIPENGTQDGVNAKYDKGVLEITIPKKQPEPPRAATKKVNIS
jgi:HSP20 family protein